jgi:hypothetical protein
MLSSTKKKLDALYAGRSHLGTDGKLYEIDRNTNVSPDQGAALANLHRTTRPRLSIEIGMAYGFSTLFVLDAMKVGKYGRHIALDSFQRTLWHGIGLQAVRDAGLSGNFGRFRWLEERSAFALSQM